MYAPVSISSAQDTHAHICPNRDDEMIRIPITHDICPYCQEQLGGGSSTIDAAAIREEAGDRVVNFLAKTARFCWGIVFGMPR
jgi:hypothetical protein